MVVNYKNDEDLPTKDSDCGLVIANVSPTAETKTGSLKFSSVQGAIVYGNGDPAGLTQTELAFINRSEYTVAMKIGPNSRVEITGSLYVNGAPKSVDSMLVNLEKEGKLKDKLIEKLSERLDELEKKLKNNKELTCQT